MKNGIEILELMQKVIRESNANKFIDKEASKLNSSQKEKLKNILVKYEEFLSVLNAEAEK